jgi:xanthine dehydrogenase YagR molybdenum-binding subunit
VRLAADPGGRLQAIEVKSWGSAGVGTGAGVAGPFHVIYDCPNRRSEEHDVFTNAGPAAAFRAPGHPQGAFALESAMDELADALGRDPIDLRLANDRHPTRRLQWALARDRFGWDALRAAPRRDGALVRGVGAASSVWYNIVEQGVGATVEVHGDGSVVVLSGVQDIGGGIRTVIGQVAAEVLGLDMGRIEVRIGSSQLPLGPGSGGSKTTASLAPVVHQAADQVRRKLARLAAPILGVPEDRIVFEGGVARADDSSTRIAFAELCSRMRQEKLTGHGERTDDLAGLGAQADPDLALLAQFIAGVQLVEVAVDTETGVVRVERVLAVQDCGRVMNPLAARGQVNGGVIQGIGYALYEERILDRRTGLMLNPNLEGYRVPGLREVPPIDVVFTPVWSGLNSTGAMGLGEPVTVPTAAAIGNAVAHALGGKRVRSLPMTPERVLQAIRG